MPIVAISIRFDAGASAYYADIKLKDGSEKIVNTFRRYSMLAARDNADEWCKRHGFTVAEVIYTNIF